MEATTEVQPIRQATWLDRPISMLVKLNWEITIFSVIIILAFFTRFFMLENRSVSHDETSHTYFSWLLFQGKGYQHDPITHGPFQFHIIALSYFLFGDNDFTARIPVALFGVAAIAFIWFYRRFLGRAGALVAGFLLLISPYILYYDRYVRNESYVALFALLLLWAVLGYLESGKSKYLFFLTLAIVLHFITKETAYIYVAQLLIFLALYFVYSVIQKPWKDNKSRTTFLILVCVGILLGAGALMARELAPKAAAAPPADTTEAAPAQGGTSSLASLASLGLMGLAGVAFLGAGYFLLTGFTLKAVRGERSFDLLMLVGSLILPLLAAFPLEFLKVNVPTNAAGVNALTAANMLQIGIGLLAMFLIMIAVGLWWNPRLWLANAALFYSIFIVFYTTLFTNGAGFFTGLLGGLAYWLVQQGVQRGSQPWYYYALVQIPVYEYLPAIGVFLACFLAIFGVRIPSLQALRAKEEAEQYTVPDRIPDIPIPDQFEPIDLESNEISADLAPAESTPAASEPRKSNLLEHVPVFGLLLFWSLTSLAAYSYAGEKMPWLTVHITLPMILLAGWGLGYVIETIHWERLNLRDWLVFLLLPVFFIALGAGVGAVLGPTPPFQGKSLDQLQATSTFMTAVLGFIASGVGLLFLIKDWRVGQILRSLTLTFFALLALLTIHTTVLANYFYYDEAVELLVYAHTGPGIKEALSQIQQLSRLTAGQADQIQVAYDNETTYPYWWYLRNFPNQRYYGTNPTRDLRQVPVILVGEANYSKIEPVVGNAYYKFDFIRMWWPNQDYFNLDSKRIAYAITNPEMRAAIFSIWLNQDYRAYAQVTKQDLSLPNWTPSAHMRLYIRKDIAAQVWNYGASATNEPVAADPYEGKELKISADKIIGGTGKEPGQLQTPRNVAVAPDGSLYVVDTGNNRIQHMSPDGTVLKVFGSPSATGNEPGAPGTFNEPWSAAVGKDGSVYVADTWNHRIQKFDANGNFIKMWGTFGQGTGPYVLWGPRSVAIDAEGRVLVSDTGNKRVVVYDADGNFISQVGTEGMQPGQFSEPVGIALDSSGRLYVDDTWNQRVQVLAPDGKGGFTPLKTWDISGWYGQSLDNKPYIAVSGENVFVTDPEGYRVLEFTLDGTFVQFWGNFGAAQNMFGLPNGIAADAQGNIWVADSGNNRIMHFTVKK